MKATQITAIAFLSLAMVSGCGKSEPAADGDKAKPAAEGAEGAEAGDKAGEAEEPKVEVPKLTITEADWVEKDLKEVSPMIDVTIKAPKDATFEKNGNGGVDIKLAPFYMITVGNLAVSDLKEALGWGESMSIGDSSYKDGKKLVDEENGFVFTYQMNDEENGHKYAPESHFFFFIEKDGAMYSINDTKPLDTMMTTPNEAYTEELARQVYGLVKGSAKAN